MRRASIVSSPACPTPKFSNRASCPITPQQRMPGGSRTKPASSFWCFRISCLQTTRPSLSKCGSTRPELTSRDRSSSARICWKSETDVCAFAGTQLAPGGVMELDNQRASSNVEDRRGMGMVGGGLGIGGIAIALIAYFLGVDPGTVTSVAEQVAPQRATREAARGTPADEMGQFVSKVLGSTEDVWGRILERSGSQYRRPTL